MSDATDSTETPSVYVLTVRNPWAWAIIHAGKDIENRTWRITTPVTLLIQASRKFGRDEDAALRSLQALGVTPASQLLSMGDFHNGYVIGKVDVTACDPGTSRSKWAVPGLWHWKLENPVAAALPFPVTGRAGLFRPPAYWPSRF